MLLGRAALEAAARGSVGAPLVVEAEAENYTPIMLGDHMGRHFRRDPSSGRLVASPGLYAQAIRGKARWLARVAVASLKGCECSSYRCVEGCFPTRPLSGREEKKSVGLVELLYGKVGEPSLASPFTLTAVPDAARLAGAAPWQPPEHPLLRGARYGFDRYSALLTMGEGGKRLAEEMAPQPPGSVRLSIRVGVRPGARRLLEEAGLGGRLDGLACFYASTVLAAPLLLGLGKAANRGFGRFRYEKIEAKEGFQGCPSLGRVIEAIRGLQEASGEAAAGEALRRLLEAIVEAAASAAASEPGRPGLSLIPRLLNAYQPPGGVKAGASVVETRASSMDEAIEFIAAATLKQKWKTLRGRVTDSGVNYHTWPLGLPRGSAIKCRCNGRGGSKQRFGYIVVEEAQFQKDEDCLLHSKCAETEREQRDIEEQKDSNKKSTPMIDRIDSLVDIKVKLPSGKRTVNAKDVRRQSMYVLFPLPTRGPRGVLVAALPLVALDLNLGVEGSPKELKGYKLLHVGGHVPPGERPPPCCSGHVVEVGYALRENQVGVGLRQPQGTCGCGTDPGGAAYPKQVKTRAGYLDAVNAAWEWVTYCLRHLRPEVQHSRRGDKPEATCRPQHGPGDSVASSGAGRWRGGPRPRGGSRRWRW